MNCPTPDEVRSEISRVQSSFESSYWLKYQLATALLRDAGEAAQDAVELSSLLAARCATTLTLFRDAAAPRNIENTVRSPASSTWLRHALASAAQRDPVDAAHDAEHLMRLLARRAEATVGTDCSDARSAQW